MKFYNEEAKKTWDNTVKINDDPYGKLIVGYAENCMNLMEQRLNEGALLKDIWRSSLFGAKGADQQSGFSASCAHNIIAKVWCHGEEFANLAATMYPHYKNEEWQSFFADRKAGAADEQN